ncbi:hypothetical protein Desor_3906 [Desulfosporosinus orientis DSM 765]|uniref:Uncharacterized protein n=1 Tax=Desulfosporosinus orientis (strain ATCC 19365 / DSM 765 / NCIMB 8382 / VKM B-1628 / Singapore I) TaxID=768706 RepID=G7WBV4_DESOD|nr:hypothetical protein Desor_3906 [Desulfosporosinus orientis DSM 765]
MQPLVWEKGKPAGDEELSDLLKIIQGEECLVNEQKQIRM